MAFTFHAAAPPGEWINDPNGLIHMDGVYHLFAQHSRTAPDFREIGWGRFTSPDLLSWAWAGVVLPSTAEGSAYSGSVIASSGGWEAFFTRHDPAGPSQGQHRALSDDAASWGELPGPIGPSGRNMRDPFVFWSEPTGDWRMLVAQPCDWTEWRADSPSRLQVWRSPDRVSWVPCGSIGPWSPAGVMWEVPVLMDFGEMQVLILSLVDRRSDQAECSTRYWPGRWDESGFTPAAECPGSGLPLDLGPDFYAAIPNAQTGWPTGERILLGWASNWRTARSFPWPGDAKGGPISLPRRVEMDGPAPRLLQTPIAVAEEHVHWTGEFDGNLPFELHCERAGHSLVVRGRPADRSVTVERHGSEVVKWSATHEDVLEAAGLRSLRLFADGPLLELFIGPDGLAVTAALPGDGALRIQLTADTPQ